MPPRIAHIISTRGVGGAEHLLGALVTGAHARGFDQIVLNPFATDGSAALTGLCSPVPYHAQSCDRLRDLPGLRRWLGTKIAAFEPDIIHVLLFHALVTATLPKRAGTGMLLTHVYGDWVQSAPHGKIIRLLDRRAGQRFDVVVAISDAVRRFLVCEYGYPPSKVKCIPLGWRGNPLPAVTCARRPTVICVAGLRPEKGHDLLLRAFALVLDHVPDARLVLIGEGECRSGLEAQIAASGMSGSVDLLGSVPDIWPHLAAADVFALASRYEAFGIAITEAMAAGLPVVACSAGAIPELVRPGETGELFPVGDAEALAGHLVRLLISPELRSRMSDEARVAAESFRMDLTVERYFGVYQEMLDPMEIDRRHRRRLRGNPSAGGVTA